MRYKSLDSVRGLAAIIVLFHHSLLVVADNAPIWIKKTPLRIFFAGPGAVALFFCLSGFVLYKAVSQQDRQPYLAYVIKRIMRIWLPFVAALFFAIALASAAPSGVVENTSQWFMMTWSEKLTASVLLSHFFMLGNHISLDNPMWSLVHEMRISILFPLLAALVTAFEASTLIASILVMMGFVFLREYGHVSEFGRAIFATCDYIFLFVFGVMIAKRSSAVQRFADNLHSLAKVALWGVAIGLVAMALQNMTDISSNGDIIKLIGSGIGSSLIVCLAIGRGRVKSLLEGPVASYFGRISFPLYLLHVPIIIFSIRVLHNFLPIAAILPVAAVASLLVADVFQRLIEAPAMNFGRKLAQRFTISNQTLSRKLVDSST